MVKVQLRDEPDGMGFIYGTIEGTNGQTLRVDIMPPETHWRGGMRMERYGRHPTEWVVTSTETKQRV